LDKGDASQIKTKTEALAQISMKIGEQLYKAQQETAASGEAQGAGTEAKPEEPDVVDAEFSEVKDEKKA